MKNNALLEVGGSGSPYHDDFDAKKNFMALLFNPGRAVQARELTQIGTTAQNQISCISNYFFKNGAPISGGRISFSYNSIYMKVNSTDSAGQKVDVSSFIGRMFTGQTSGQSILVTGAEKDKNIIFFSYLGADITNGETFISTASPAKEFIMLQNSVSNAVLAKCTEGTLYINGYFVQIPEQTITVAYDDLDAEYNIGFLVERDIKDSGDDASLNDPAAGFYNYNAPGADRYYIGVKLFSYKTGEEIDETLLDNYAQGIVIRNREMILEQQSEVGNGLMDVLAKRTYDESGSYTVKPWYVYLEEHPTDLSKYIVSVQPGEGYIHGYNVKNIVSKDIEVVKPRTEQEKAPISLYNKDTAYTYVLIDDTTLALSALGVLDFSKFETVEVMTGEGGTGSVIGECNVLSLYREGNRVILYLANTAEVRNSFSGARSIRSKANPTQVWMNLLVDSDLGVAVLYGQERSMITDTGYSPVRSLVASSVSYESVKKYSTTSEASGNSIYLVDSNDSIDFKTSESLIAIYETNTGKNINITNALVIPDNSSTISSAMISSPEIQNGTAYTVVLRVEINNTSARLKILKAVTINVELNRGVDTVSLGKEDIFDLISVKATNNVSSDNTDYDFKDHLVLDNGQRDYFYEEGSLSGFSSDAVTGKLATEQSTTFSITFRYFEHSGVGAFSANSYATNANIQTAADIPDLYVQIPKYRATDGTIFNLRDCLDFRIKRSELGTGFSLFPAQRTEVSFAVVKYLPRMDTVWVSRNGDFGVTTGIPSENPEPPQTKDGTMEIYNILNKAYVTNMSDVTLQYIDNQRYTMKDIAKISKRVSNMEEVISITQLEQSAIQTQILDDDGTDKYKTGVFTDNLGSFDNSDFTNSEWDCTIDGVEQSLRPQFRCEHRTFSVNKENSTNVSLTAPCYTLPYTTTVYAQNVFASNTKNIQDLMVYTWKGALTLSPSVDTWVNDLGNIPVSETWVDTPKPPTTYRTWSTTKTYSNAQLRRSTGLKVVTNYTETTNYNSTWIVNDTILKSNRKNDEYMRNTKVSYECTGLRPGVSVVGTMDEKPLELSNSTVDSDGNLTGYFIVPDKMPCGSKIVRINDEAKGSINSSTTTAEATYTANGVTIWNDVQRENVRSYEPVKTITSTERSYPYDPIAETFYVSEPNGILLESIDVFFKSKDESASVDLYIVTCENGIPTDNKVPFSTVSLTPKQVNLGVDTPTKFRFLNPIYLTGNTEYAFVLISSSYNYNVYISTLGEKDIVTGQQIIEQPFTGSLLSSQNARTWTPEQQSDIKFTMHRCNFSTNTEGVLEFDIDKTDASFSVAQMTLVANTFLTKNTGIKYEYKWNTESLWTEFNNAADVFLTQEKTIHDKNDETESLKVRMILSTTDSSLSPIVDSEQVYGIFTNNICKSSSEAEFPYTCGTYISKTTTLENESSDIRIIIDAILPGKSDVDAYVKTNSYSPLYVEHSRTGNLGMDSANADFLVGNTAQIYYYNAQTKQLEPKSQLIVTGYDKDTRKIYLRSVGNPVDFKNASGDNNEVYAGLNEKYTDILLLPVFSESNIPADNWTQKQYNAGDYVIHDGEIWKAKIQTLQNSTPSDVSVSWEKIHSLKTATVTKNDEVVEWRKLTKEANSFSTADKESQFLEYRYFPEVEFESDFRVFSVKLVLKSKNTIDVPRVRNIRAIATV